MALFKQKNIILVVDPKKVELARVDIDAIGEGVLGDHRYRRKLQCIDDGVLDRVDMLTSCSMAFTEIVWTDLYNSRYNPPSEWKNSITIIIEDLPEDVSENSVRQCFAEYYSKSYYFDTRYCSLKEALDEMKRVLGGERFYYGGIL